MWNCLLFLQTITFVVANEICDATRQSFQDMKCCGSQQRSVCVSPTIDLDSLSKNTLRTCDGDEMVKRDYTGTTLHIVLHEGTVQGQHYIANVYKWASLTGAEVKVEQKSADSLYSSILSDKYYDVHVAFTNFVDDMNSDAFASVPESYLKTQPFRNQNKNQRDRVKHGNDYKLWSAIDGDSFSLKYRSDILENASYKDEFSNKYNVSLAVPKTWKQLLQICEFFKDKDWNQNGDLTDQHCAYPLNDFNDLAFAHLWHGFLAPSLISTSGQYFYHDLNEYEPTMNNSAFRDALNDYKKIVKMLPSAWQQTIGLGQEIYSVLNEPWAPPRDVLFTFAWDDYMLFVALDTELKRKFKIAPMPMSSYVYDKETRVVSERNLEYNVGVNIWGWAYAVNKHSNHKDASFDLLCYLSHEKMRKEAMMNARSGTNPVGEGDMSPYYWENGALNIPRILAESFAQSKLSSFNAPIQVIASGYTGQFDVEGKFVGPNMKKFVNDELSDVEMVDVFVEAFRNISHSEHLRQDMEKVAFAYVEQR